MTHQPPDQARAERRRHGLETCGARVTGRNAQSDGSWSRERCTSQSRTDRFGREAAPDHVRDVEIFVIVFRMVEFQRAVVGEPAPHTGQGLLVFTQPRPKPCPPLIRAGPLALLAPEAAVYLSAQHSTDLEGVIRAFLAAVFANFHGCSFQEGKRRDEKRWKKERHPPRGGVVLKSGRVDLNLRPHGPEPCALAKLSYAPCDGFILAGNARLSTPIASTTGAESRFAFGLTASPSPPRASAYIDDT